MTLLQQKGLLLQLVRRDVLTRYRGALLGLLWMLLSPLIMLAIFAFVFGQIFQSRWPQQTAELPFWLMLYAGLIVFNTFAESVSRAPGAVRNYPNYVKKIIFPVTILPLVPVGAGIVHAVFNIFILTVALAVLGKLSFSLIWFPVLMIPVLLLATGMCWFFAAWGVFIRDMTQVVPLFVQMLLFLSPVFYPVSVVPEFLRPFYGLNPLGAVIESVRAAMLGNPIPWPAWFGALALGLLIGFGGYWFFERNRYEFADVL